MSLLMLYPLPSPWYSVPATKEWPQYPISRDRVRKADPINLMTEVRPQIVEPPVKPIDLVVKLPSITGDSRVRSGGNSCSTNETTINDEPGSDWMCRLSTWVDGNPLLAVGAVAGIFVLMSNKSKSRR